MIPATFAYEAPKTPEAALELLAANEGAVLLAGGHTLLTALKERTLRPAMLVDIARIGLDRLELDASGDLVIGAGVNQAMLAEFCDEHGWPLLAEIGVKSGDPMIRARGTFVGALCAVESGGDWVAAALALDVKVKLLTHDGEQVLRLDDYINKPKPNPHLVLEAIVPASMRKVPQGYEKVKHAAIGWSVASVAHVQTDKGIQLAATGAIARPQRLTQLEEDVVSLNDGDPMEAIEASLSSLSFVGDRYAPADWRRKRLKLVLRDILSSYNQEEKA